MAMAETVQRIEPARLEEPGEAISDVVAAETGLNRNTKAPLRAVGQMSQSDG